MGRMGPYGEATEAEHPRLREVAEREGMDKEELTAARKFGYTDSSVTGFFEVTTRLVEPGFWRNPPKQ
jgi:hypothetical protein